MLVVSAPLYSHNPSIARHMGGRLRDRTTLLLLLFAHIPVSLAVYGGLTEEPVHMIRGTQRQSPVRSADAELVTTIVGNECKAGFARS